MVYEYGMGTSIRSHQVPADDYTVSEALRRTRDEEVQAISEEAYRGAYHLLADHRDLLDEIAERLIANELIERDEIREIMDRSRSGAPEPGELREREDARRLAGEAAEALASEPPDEPL
jgi:ATP-dependent Zn protease